MRSSMLAAVLLLACLVGPVVSVHVSEFDSTVSDFAEFTQLLELTEAHEAETNEHLGDSEIDLALLEVTEGEGENPSYTLAYPPITYASHHAGGFLHPFSNVNPLSAPWAGFAPVAGPAHVPTAAAIGATPLSAYYGGALHPALGINTNLFPAAFQVGGADAKGGYNVHGLNAGNVFGGYHPGLANDLTSLGGKAGAGGEEAAGFLEASAVSGQSHQAFPLASESHDPANIATADQETAYGLFPAPTPESGAHFVRSNMANLGPHKLQFEGVGSNEIDAAFPAFVEMESEANSESEMEAEAAIDADADALLESEVEMADATIDPVQELETALVQVADDGEGEAEGGGEEGGGEEGGEGGGEEGGEEEGGAAAGGGEGGANPSYTLPYPPVLPGHFSPLFNPYTNVNPLSTPFANYAAQPGGHPGVAAAAAAQAGGLAAINSHIAGGAGGYPYYPYNSAVGLGGVVAGGVPFSGYAGWIHPQNLNSASVGENADAASLGQFLEIATEETEHGDCVGCNYN